MNDLQPENPDSSTLLAKVLERHGWEVRSIDIDLVAGRATVEIH